jgi:hypothetical protein
MNRSQIIALFDREQRIDIEYPGTRREVVPDLVRLIDTSGNGEGMVIYSRLNETNADEAIRAQMDYFENLGQDFEWKTYDYDTPPDLKERLVSHGFILNEVEAVMLLDLQAAPPVLWQPLGHAVRRILDPAELSDVLSINQQVWNEDSSRLIQYLGETITRFPEQMSVYVAYMDGQPASAAWIFFPPHSRFADLYGGSTIRAYRQRGLYTALLAQRAQAARDRQVRYLVVDASPMSRPILEKFGFELIAYSYPCRWKHTPRK